MPTYDYQCDDCGHTFEEFQNISADLLTDCPECKKSTLRRLFGTGAAIMFKGSGFYETDYRSDSYKAGAKNRNPRNPLPPILQNRRIANRQIQALVQKKNLSLTFHNKYQGRIGRR